METVINIVRRTKQQISVLNFFALETIRSENFDVQKAIISTRLYIILLTLILTTLTLYSLLDSQNKNVII